MEDHLVCPTCGDINNHLVGVYESNVDKYKNIVLLVECEGERHLYEYVISCGKGMIWIKTLSTKLHAIWGAN